jgi:hypothetical protein
MDYRKVIEGVMTYGNYKLMRDSGSTPVELEYFHSHIELEKQYQSGLTPDQLGKDIIDSANCRAVGGLQ